MYKRQARNVAKDIWAGLKNVVGGEISEIANISTEDIKTIVHEALNKTIKTSFEDFDLDRLSIYNELTPQSEEIRAAVEEDEDQGAGDQGIMIGFATNKTESFMPPTFDISRNIQKTLWDLQNSDPMLDLDSKVQVTTGGDKAKVVVSTQHKKEINIQKLHDQVSEIVAKHVNQNFQLDLNPSGSFIKGGPAGDTGLTGRKIVVDAYGPSVPVGGGAFSGKDPSKVDRSAAYAARHIAKNIVAADIASEVLVQLSYAIGISKPTSIFIDTFGSSKIDRSDREISDLVSKIFDLTPFGIEKST